MKANDGTVSPKGPVPLWRWAVWSSTLAAALVVFYGFATPVWVTLRGAAWVAELRARRRR